MDGEANSHRYELDDELNGSRCVQDEEAAERRRDHGADGQSRTSRWSQRAMPSIKNSEKGESCEPDRLRNPSAQLPSSASLLLRSCDPSAQWRYKLDNRPRHHRWDARGPG